MIHAVILAGGWGRRFWPQSRSQLPKQLLCLGDSHSLIQNLFNKIKSQIPKERIWVVANKRYAPRLRRHLPSLQKNNLLVEPLSKNTAAAIALACVTIKRVDPEAVTLILSSDHVVGQKRRFLKAIKEAWMFAQQGDVLVTIGIRPDRPAVEYGYLKIAQSAKRPPAHKYTWRAGKTQNAKIYKVEKFVEKPGIQKAKAYLRNKHYLWNSGIFAWKATSILQAIKRYLPQLYAGLQRIEKTQGTPRYRSRLASEYKKFKNISIDYAVMEKARNIYTVMGNFPWQDLGSWISLTSGLLAKDSRGNIIRGLYKGIDTCNSVIFSEPKHLIATLGIRDLIVVHTPSATLVCKKDKAQEVKKLTEILDKDKRLRRYL